MRPSLNWQPLLLIASFSLAIALAVGGWALGRWRSREHAEPAKLRPARQSVQANLPVAVEAKDSQKSIATPNPEGSILLEPSRATLRGAVTRSLTAGEDALVGWTSLHDSAAWQFRAPRPGFYSAELTYATTDAAAEAELELRVDDRRRFCSLRSSGGLEQFVTDEYPVAVPSSGVHQLTIQPHSDLPGPWLVLRSVRLIPTKTDKAGGAPQR
jgi:hypothetical protein